MPQKILLVSTMLFGDGLLATGLTRSLRVAYPNSQIDVLVTRNGRLAFEGNPDIDAVIHISKKPSFKEMLQFARENFRKYDLVLNDRDSERPVIYSLIAGKMRIGFVKPKIVKLQSILYSHAVDIDATSEHRFYRNMRLLEPLGIKKEMRVVSPEPETRELPFELPSKYLVLHAPASMEFKQWPVSGWKVLANQLAQSGYFLVFTGAKSERDQEIVNQVSSALPERSYLDASGKLTIQQTSLLIKNSMGFVGPDTGPAHLASGYNIKQILLFGGTLPDVWAPWPYEYAISSQPFSRRKAHQTVNNITVLQSELECVPCNKGYCQRTCSVKPDCLADISARRVFDVIQHEIPLN
ncbi:lipopolysaccharide heptosyltransferase III [Vibrio ishigakensis]|uniref:Lipopolysaccharide heptosyltransferase III n=1 Tax=Vibrio ishigakensis TaxID=1481914 RepID=A0A0B8QSQ4_9VIBR|nr:lipopolysaccharide heptosyltransferase III [Vibrio ishigakensis]